MIKSVATKVSTLSLRTRFSTPSRMEFSTLNQSYTRHNSLNVSNQTKVLLSTQNQFKRTQNQFKRLFSASSQPKGSSDEGDSVFAQAMRQKKEAEAKNSNPESGKKESSESDDGKETAAAPEPDKKKSGGIGWAVGLGVVATYIALGQLSESPDIPGEDLFTAHNRKCKEAIVESYEYFMDPPKKALLPPLPPQIAREHTLCIELNDALTHLVWDVDIGWRVAIRPGAKKLLYTLHQYFELVVFTNTPSHLASPVIDVLDNYGLFHYRLFREHHRLDKDTHLKDLSFLNRDLSKVIVVDTTTDSFGTHPENGILIKKWTGEKGDKELYKMTAFLQELLIFATSQKITDLRPLLATIKSYDEKDIPHAWQQHKDNLRDLIKKKQESSSVAESTKTTPQPSSFMNLATSTLQALVGSGGIAKGINRNTATPIDRIEQYCKESREILDKELESHMKNAEAHRKEQEEMIKKQIEEIKNSDLKWIDYLTGNVPGQGQQPPAAN